MDRRLIVALLLAGIANAQTWSPRVEEIIQYQVTNKKFMGSVLIAKGNDVLFSRGYGSADLEWNIPNSPATKFRLGSITKQFTAACVMLLQERGKLKVSDPVKTYMPDAPAAWDKITLYNLLTHTSGIPNYTNFLDFSSLEVKPTTPKDMIEWFRNKPLDFEPGSKWNYSNSGYVLLGYLIEKVTGETYQHFLDENILIPVGLKDTGYDSNTAIIPHRASGYMHSKTGIINAPYIDMTTPFSAGALYSTTGDLLKWERALFGGKVVSAESLKEMTTPFKQNYGFALAVETVNGRKRIEHGGGINGFNTDLVYWADDQLTIVVLGNINGNAPEAIASQLAATIHGERVILPSERKEIKVDPETLKAYVGSYEFMPHFVVTVTLEGDHLQAQFPSEEKEPLFAESPTMFFLKTMDAQLEFAKDASGKVTQVTLHESGRSLTGKPK